MQMHTASSDSDVPDTTHAFMHFHESTCLETLNITMSAPTVEPNEKKRAARRHMEHTNFGNVRIHRKSTTDNLPLAISDTR